MIRQQDKPEASTREPMVLVVDDSEIIRITLREILERDGYRVRTLSNGRDVVSTVAANPPELILLDIRMPDVGGLEVLEILQQREDTCHVPVVILTASDAPENIAYAFSAGATDYLVKPCTETVVRSRVRAILKAKSPQHATGQTAEKSMPWIRKQPYLNAERAGKAGPWAWNVETDQLVLSSSMQSMLGISDEELPTTMSQWMQSIHEDDRYQFKAALTHRLEGLDGYGKDFDTVLRMHHQDGSLRWLLARVMVETNSAGGLPKVEGVMSDVSDLKRAESAWRDSESWSKAILDNAVDGIVNCNQYGIIQSFNKAAAKIFGYEAQEVVGRNVSILVPSPAAEEHDKYLESYLQTKQSKIIGVGREVEAVRKDGSKVSLLISVSEVCLGEQRGFSAMVRDLTERERINRELLSSKERAEAADRTKSEFLANMSHEIRTPLNAILGFSDLLLKNETQHSEEERIDYLQTIHTSGNHLLEIINDILDLSKIEAGTVKSRSVPSSPYHLVAEVVSMLRVRAREKNVSLEVTYQGKIPQVIQTDPSKLRQLLLNLMGNAIKFTQQGGVELKVWLNEESPQPLLVFEVSDTGIGISHNMLETIFEPFVQVDTSATRKYNGAGLGLSISKRIAELLGGSLRVRSEIGKGSVFTLETEIGSLEGVEMVEAEEGEALMKDRQARDIEEPATKLTGRILVVDDGASNRKLFRLTLENAGASVTLAEDGQEGLEAALQEPFDIILMDMQMPVLNGYQATQKLRDAGHTIPIIALTAHTSIEDEEKCLLAGCSGLLTKPIEASQLVSAVAKAIGQTSVPSSAATSKTSKQQEDSRELVSTLPLDDIDFLEIIEEFTVTMRTKIEAMKAAIQARDWVELAQLAHWLKGAGGTAGFSAFTQPTADLERFAQDNNLVMSTEVIESIVNIAERIVVTPTAGVGSLTRNDNR